MRRLIRRLSIYLLAIWAAVTINFFLPRLAPGNPAEVAFFRLQQRGAVTPATLTALENEFGVNTRDPLSVAIGNYYNDLAMLSIAGVGVAVDNAPDDVKAQADLVVASNNDSGVAEALTRLVL